MMVEPEYYSQHGLSPLQAFEQGLLSNEQFVGFCKGNVIKYTVRAGSKDDALLDIVKAMDYLKWLHKALKEDGKATDINMGEVLNFTPENEETLVGMDGRKTRLRPKPWKNTVPINGKKYEASGLQGNIFTRTLNKLKNKEEEY